MRVSAISQCFSASISDICVSSVKYYVIMNLIKHKLRELREKNGMPLSELEQLTDIPHATMSRLFSITDDSSPSFDNVMKVVIALEGSLDEIMGIKAPNITETPLTRTYNMLLAEKDKMIAEKDDHIHRLQIANANEREEKNKERHEKRVIAVALLAVLAVVLTVLIIDITNGGIGYVRY